MESKECFYSLLASLFTVLRVDETEKRSKLELRSDICFTHIHLFTHMKQKIHMYQRIVKRIANKLSDENSLHCLEIIM